MLAITIALSQLNFFLGFERTDNKVHLSFFMYTTLLYFMGFERTDNKVHLSFFTYQFVIRSNLALSIK